MSQAATSRATPGYVAAFSPTIENDAVTPYRRRIRRICGVYTGLGPSSIVRATTFLPSLTVDIGSP